MTEPFKIPMADPLVGEEEARAVYDVVKSGWLSAGPNVPNFERAFAELVGVKHAVAFCNGTVALHAILLALNISKGDEVIVPTLHLFPLLHPYYMPVQSLFSRMWIQRR